MMNSRLRGINFRFLGLITPLATALLIALFLLRAQVSFALHTAAFSLGRLIWPITNQTDELNKLSTARHEALTKENEELKVALGYFVGQAPHLAYVLSSLRSSPYETIIIDQGSAACIEYGHKVMSEESVALCEVVEVYDDISKIRLYSTYGNELEVVLPDGTHVLAEGAGSQNFVLKLPRGLVIEPGSLLTLPSSNNLIFAEVKEVKESQGDVFQIVYARSPVNVYSLSRVYVEN